MLKKSLLAAGLVVGMFMPASAEFSVDSLTAVTQGQDININMSAHNPGDTDQQGPIMLKLMARGNPTGQWVELTSWNVESLRAGETLSKSYTATGAAAAARKSGDYECKVVVGLPGEDKYDEDARVIITK